MSTPTTADEVASAIASEYGQYVAAEVIYINGARAFNPGHAVPTSHVERGLVNLDQVRKISTKAGQALLSNDDVKG